MGNGPSQENRRVFDRVASRIVCELVIEGRAERAFVLDLSARGLFVQTQSMPATGTEATVRVQLDDGPSIDLQATVARIRKVHPQAATLMARGVGLELKMAPEEYYRLLQQLAD